MQAEQTLQGIMRFQEKEKDEKYIGQFFKNNTKTKGVY